MTDKLTGPQHEAFYQDLVKLLNKHTAHLSAEEMLAISANVVGKLVAYQDQRTMTSDRALDIVSRNIEIGNEHARAELMNTKGRA